MEKEAKQRFEISHYIYWNHMFPQLMGVVAEGKRSEGKWPFQYWPY